VKRIRNVSDDLVVLNEMTLDAGADMPLVDPELLESEEVKQLLDTGRIAIIDDEPPARP
jgi:hypothetical protein